VCVCPRLPPVCVYAFVYVCVFMFVLHLHESQMRAGDREGGGKEEGGRRGMKNKNGA
jgi:hypothetical protein